MSGLLEALLVNGIAAVVSIGARLVRPSAAWGGLVVGTLIYWGSGWRGFVILLTFFVVGVGVTKLGYREKEARGLAEPNKGRRGSAHALANGGAAALASLIALVWPDFRPFLPAFVLGSFGSAIADTTGSEIGQLWGKNPISPLTLRSVAPGTPGAVSREGTIASLGATALLAVLALAIGFVSLPGAIAGGIGGVVGGITESIVGAGAWFRARGHMTLNAGNTFLGGIVGVAIFFFLR